MNVRIAEQVSQNSFSEALSNKTQATHFLKITEKINELGTHSMTTIDKA